MLDKHFSELETGMLLVLRYRILDVQRYWSPSILPNSNEPAHQPHMTGAVYRALDLVAEDTEQLVAVLERSTPNDPEHRKRTLNNIEHEANIIAALNHAAVPTILDYFTTSDRTYLVTPFEQGTSLNDVVQSPSYADVSLKTITRWIVEICDLIAYMHDDDPPLVFRTLAAEKLAIDKTGYVNFTDMTGIGVYAGEQRGIPMGVDGYAAPEQYSGEHVPQSDIYSIGALLHYLLTGHDPRRAKRFSFVDRPVRHLNPKVSKDLDMIVYKALAFEPKYRFKTVREMQDALNAL